MKRYLAAAFWALCGLLFLGCRHPQYALYTSPSRDFQCRVPWAWDVMSDAEGAHFANVTFLGPFDPAFYLGAPSFSVRWYARSATHRLRDGTLEMYKGPDDYIQQTLETVYGKDRRMERPVQDLAVDGRKFKYFVVVSAGPAQAEARWGTALDETGKVINPRKHAYAVFAMPGGCYVLIYPATRQGYEKYQKEFDELVKSFVPLKDGPGGALSPSPAQAKPVR